MKDSERINQRTLIHNTWTGTIMWRSAWGVERVGPGKGWKGRKVGKTVTT